MINFARVSKNIYRGGAPSINDVKRIKEKFGVKTIISLDKDSGEKIDRICKLLKIKHIMLPIDMWKKATLIQFLRANVVKLIQDNEPVFIHCFHGKDRTGLAIALYRAQVDKWPYKKIMEEAHSFGYGLDVEPRIIETYDHIIHKACDKNDVNNASGADIVEMSRGTSNPGSPDFIVDEFKEHNFVAPFPDSTIAKIPYITNIDNFNEQFDTRQTRGLNDQLYQDEDVPSVPQVGIYDGVAGIQGAGPSLIGSGIIT